MSVYQNLDSDKIAKYRREFNIGNVYGIRVFFIHRGKFKSTILDNLEQAVEFIETKVLPVYYSDYNISVILRTTAIPFHLCRNI